MYGHNSWFVKVQLCVLEQNSQTATRSETTQGRTDEIDVYGCWLSITMHSMFWSMTSQSHYQRHSYCHFIRLCSMSHIGSQPCVGQTVIEFQNGLAKLGLTSYVGLATARFSMFSLWPRVSWSLLQCVCSEWSYLRCAVSVTPCSMGKVEMIIILRTSYDREQRDAITLPVDILVDKLWNRNRSIRWICKWCSN